MRKWAWLLMASVWVGCATRPLASGGTGGAGQPPGATSDLGAADLGFAGGGDAGGGGGTGGDSGVGDAPDAGPIASRPVQLAPVASYNLPGNYLGDSSAIGDVTGDGLADVVVAAHLVSPRDVSLFVFPQLADGTLGAPIRYATGSTNLQFPASLAVGDVNGDGRLDAVMPFDDAIGIFLQTAAGELAAIETLPSTIPGSNQQSVIVADFDGDGRVDVAAVPSGGPAVDVWYQAGDGSLTPARSFASPAGGFAVLAAGDFDGDGVLDLAVNGYGEQISVLRGQPGGFADAQPLATGNFDADTLAAGDLDGDGRAEIALIGGGDNGLFGLAGQNGDGSWGAWAWQPAAAIPGAIVLGDLNHDGRRDAVVMHVGWDKLGVFRQLDDGSLSAEQTFDIPYIDHGAGRMAVGDINDDGRDDVVVVEQKLYVWIQQ